MINYALAKELKDAGFPQNKCGGDKYDCCVHNPGEQVGHEEIVHFPTLSELIEACHPAAMDGFVLQTGNTDEWEAGALYAGHFDLWPLLKDEDGFVHFDLNIKGQTPEEAVARLWLALNKKP